jgi:hypothetical protein
MYNFLEEPLGIAIGKQFGGVQDVTYLFTTEK